MKKLVLLVFLLMGAQVWAGSGKAVVPNWRGLVNSSSTQQTAIFISNITDHELDIRVTFYGTNGTTTTSGVTWYDFNSGNSLSAKSSGYVVIAPTTWNYGYAVIEWENANPARMTRSVWSLIPVMQISTTPRVVSAWRPPS